MSEVETIIAEFNAALVKEKRERPFDHRLICIAGGDAYYALFGAAQILANNTTALPASKAFKAKTQFEFMGIPIYQSASIKSGFYFGSEKEV